MLPETSGGIICTGEGAKPTPATFTAVPARSWTSTSFRAPETLIRPAKKRRHSEAPSGSQGEALRKRASLMAKGSGLRPCLS